MHGFGNKAFGHEAIPINMPINMHDYSHKVVIVTGGAGHIGSAVSRSYLAAGATVIICGRNAPEPAIEENSNRAQFIATNLRRKDQCQQMVEQVIAKWGRIDILINNAGGSPPLESASVDPSISEKIVQLNLLAPLQLSQLVYASMAEQFDSNGSVGNIINIASVSGARPSPGTVAYGAAKAGLLNASKSLAQEWGPKIRVNAIIVGLVHHQAGADHYGDEQGFERVASMLPLKRMAHPQDIANTCLYLSSEQASYVSGANLELDGGGEVPVFLHLAKQQSG